MRGTDFFNDTVSLWDDSDVRSYSAKYKAGKFYNDQDFVFTKDNGDPLHPDTVTDWLSKFSKRHGLPHINPHAFRHTQASILTAAGVSDVTLSGRLGHSSAAFTKNQYAHMFEDADKTSADIISIALEKRA